jgi:hypothetical protein
MKQSKHQFSNTPLGTIDLSAEDRLAIKSLPYFSKPFNDIHAISYWREQGVPFSNGTMYDHTRSTPSIANKIVEEVATMLTETGVDFYHLSWCFYKMVPGDIIPYHSDTYIAYRRYVESAGITETDQYTVHRALVTVDDREPGHILEIAGTFVDWQAGDVYVWTEDTPHLAANIGLTNRYTIQLTFVTLND